MLNKIPKDFIIVKFLNDIFNKIDLPDELKIKILETIGIKYCFQNSIIESYILERYSNIADNLYREANKLVYLEFLVSEHSSYANVNNDRTIPTKYKIISQYKHFKTLYNDNDESNFDNYHLENNTLIHKILKAEDKYGLDYILSILKIINEEDTKDYPFDFRINYSDREIFQIPSLRGNDRYHNIYIEPNNINFIKLKKEIIDFDFDTYKHIKSSYSKQDLNRLFPLFGKIKNDKRNKFNIYKLLEHNSKIQK